MANNHPALHMSTHHTPSIVSYIITSPYCHGKLRQLLRSPAAFLRMPASTKRWPKRFTNASWVREDIYLYGWRLVHWDVEHGTNKHGTQGLGFRVIYSIHVYLYIYIYICIYIYIYKHSMNIDLLLETTETPCESGTC